MKYDFLIQHRMRLSCMERGVGWFVNIQSFLKRGILLFKLLVCLIIAFESFLCAYKCGCACLEIVYEVIQRPLLYLSLDVNNTVCFNLVAARYPKTYRCARNNAIFVCAEFKSLFRDSVPDDRMFARGCAPKVFTSPGGRTYYQYHIFCRTM